MTVLATRTQSVACVREEGMVKEEKVSVVDEQPVVETTENAVVCLPVWQVAPSGTSGRER